MKKNWFQILSLALNAVLLIALLMTRAELADTQNSLKNQLDSVAWRLIDVQDQITDLSVRQREQTEDLSDFSFESTGLDPESHTLQADMSITLRRWTADTAVALAVSRGGVLGGVMPGLPRGWLPGPLRVRHANAGAHAGCRP